MNNFQITNSEINQVLSKFNFLLNLKFKTQIDTNPNSSSTGFSSFYTNSNNNSDVEYILSKIPKITIDKSSPLYYKSSNLSQSHCKIRNFYSDFLIFYQNITNKKFIIKTKTEFAKIMLKIPICQKKLILPFLKNLWVVLNSKSQNLEKASIDLIERFELSLKDIAKKNSNIADFELHRAVFDGNLRQISKILSQSDQNKNTYIYCDINEPDVNGNTPLLLALKKNNYDVVRVLCDHHADIKLKSYDGAISPFEYALKNKMIKMLKIFVNSKKNKTFFEWEQNKDYIFNLIKEIPNFTMNLKLNFDSNILNLFSSLTACDCYKISKLNGDLRIDMNLNSNKEIKGKSTLLIKSLEKKVYKIDHVNKTSYDYIEELLSDNDEEKKVSKILKEGIVNTKVYMNNLDLTDSKISKEIIGYKCNLYKVKGVVYIEKEIAKDCECENDNEVKLNTITENSFEEYFYSKTKQKIIKASSIKAIPSYKSPRLALKQNNSYIIKENDQTCNKNKKNTKITKLTKKKLDMSVWLCQDFPLTINHFLPLIHILSFSSGDFSQLENTITQNLLPFNSFPLKISFPLGLSFNALLSITNCTMEDPEPKDFDICNLNYINSESNTNPNIIYLTSNVITLEDNFYSDYYKEKNININHCTNKSISSNNDNYMQVREFPKKKNSKEDLLNKSSCLFKDDNNYCQTFNNESNKFWDVPNNERKAVSFIKIPIAPKGRNRKRNNNELERQNTIKCILQLNVSPNEILNKDNHVVIKKRDEDQIKNKMLSQRRKNNINNSSCVIY